MVLVYIFTMTWLSVVKGIMAKVYKLGDVCWLFKYAGKPINIYYKLD